MQIRTYSRPAPRNTTVFGRRSCAQRDTHVPVERRPIAKVVRHPRLVTTPALLPVDINMKKVFEHLVVRAEVAPHPRLGWELRLAFPGSSDDVLVCDQFAARADAVAAAPVFHSRYVDQTRVADRIHRFVCLPASHLSTDCPIVAAVNARGTVVSVLKVKDESSRAPSQASTETAKPAPNSDSPTPA